MNVENISEFLDWLSEVDLANVMNHGELLEDGDEGDEDLVNGDEDEGVDDVEDEGVEKDCEDMMQESTCRSRFISVGESIDTLYCTTVCFTRIPTEIKDYFLCQPCYWRYREKCHHLTKHRQASVHKTTDESCCPRLYCGACTCNLFTVCNIAICTQCNNEKKT